MNDDIERTLGIIGAAMNEGLDGQTTLNASGHAALARLEAELMGCQNLRALVDRDTREKDALRAEVERLRAVLERIADPDLMRLGWGQLSIDIARNALSKEKK